MVYTRHPNEDLIGGLFWGLDSAPHLLLEVTSVYLDHYLGDVGEFQIENPKIRLNTSILYFQNPNISTFCKTPGFVYEKTFQVGVDHVMNTSDGDIPPDKKVIRQFYTFE